MFRKIIRKIRAIKNNAISNSLQKRENKIRNIDGDYGNKLRFDFYQKRFKYLGKDVCIDTGCFFYGCEYISIDDNTHIDKGCIIVGSPEIDLSYRALKYVENNKASIIKGQVNIGKNCHISQYSMIYGYGGVKIGDNCVMSTGAKIYSLNSLPNNPHNKKEVVSIVPYSGISPTIWGPVELEENVWLGINVVVFPGVLLEKNTFARSNAVVLKSFEENSFIAGDPAIFIKNRFEV